MENRNNSRILLFVAALVAVALLAFGAGLGAGWLTNREVGPAAVSTPGANGGTSSAGTEGGPARQTPPVPEDLQDEFKSFWDTYNAIERDYYGRPVDKQKLIYGAAKGMVEALGDDYSSFLDPQEAEVVASSMAGNFQGIGIWFEMRDGIPTVVSPIPNTPAERAGIRPKDRFIAVDGRDVTQLSSDQIVPLVRGAAGTKVRITFVRNNEPFDVEITRARIEVPDVELEMLEGGYAHIKVTQFGDKATAELDRAIEEATAQNAKGIVLDVRNNGGGWVRAAQEMLGRFLPDGTVAFYESRNIDGSDDRPQYVVANGPDATRIPMVVLVNGGSASSSELVAGALQDHGRAILVGEQTFGKGSEQTVQTWEDGSSARITFAHWLTPKKRDINPVPSPTTLPGGTPPPLPTFTATPLTTAAPAIATATALARPLSPQWEGRGLTPDVVIIRTENDFVEDKDPQLDRAVEYLKNGR